MIDAVLPGAGTGGDLHLNSLQPLRRIAYRLLLDSERMLESLAHLVTDAPERTLLLEDARRVRETAAQLMSAAPRPTSDAPPVTTAPVAPRAAPRILVVDDDRSLRGLIVRQLRHFGFDPTDVEDGAHALESARRTPPDLVLTDLNMPRMNGLALIRELKSDAATRDVPVIVLSGENDLAQVVECIRNGAADYVAKPYEWSVLNARVSASIDRKRLHDAEREYRARVDRLTSAAQAVERETYRSDMLSALCARDDELGRLARVFDRVVTGLRSREDRLQHRLARLRKDMREATAATASLDESSLADNRLHTGETIAGRYEILGVLGRGGMGTVYRARDVELKEEVALKVVRPDIVRQDPAMIERLKSEIKLARRISHRNVVRAHDLGEFNGTYFITMEYVRGITVAELLDRRGRLSVASTVAIGIQLADALAMAHDAQIVHRDVKPANLLVDEDGVLKVMDFGIAVFAERPDAITMSGFVVGTPEYMAPEQLVGGTITARTDLFSAGVVLYECLSGAPPFRAESPVALLAQLSQRNVPRLRQRVSGVPDALDEIVMQMLEFQPADRPASARAIVDQLSEIEHTADDESEPDPIIAPVDLDFSL